MRTKVLIIFVGFGLAVFGKQLWACPSGQVCSDGSSDCDSSLCVADTSSSGTGSSTAPTATKDQLGLVLEPLGDNLIRVFHFDASQKDASGGGWTFYDPRPEFADVNTLRPEQIKEGDPVWIRVSQDATIQKDAASAPIPLVEGWNMIVW